MLPLQALAAVVNEGVQRGREAEQASHNRTKRVCVCFCHTEMRG